MVFKNDAQRKAVMAKLRRKQPVPIYAGKHLVGHFNIACFTKKKENNDKEKSQYMSDLMEQGVSRENAEKITKHDFTELRQQDSYDGITKTFGKTKKGKWIKIDKQGFTDSERRNIKRRQLSELDKEMQGFGRTED
jgi:hypothetical protein